MSKKLSPDGKKTILYLLLIFVVIFMLVILDVFLNSQETFEIKNENTEHQTGWKKHVETIKSTPKDTEPSMIRKSLNEIFNLMGEKKYEELFALLDKDFKKDIFNNNLDSFSSLMEKYCTKKYSPYFEKYKEYGNKYVVSVSFVPFLNTTEEILNTGTAEKSDTFFINFNEDGSYTFSCMSYAGSKKINNSVKNDVFNITLDRSVLNKTSSEYYITITNLTDTVIKIPEKTIYCRTGVKERYYSKIIEVAPNSSTQICFKIGTGLSAKNALPKKIIFENLTINDETYNFNIETDFCIDT